MIVDNILLGLSSVFTGYNMLAVAAGTGLGLVVGAMPGLSATMAIALLVPVTFVMPPETGISMLASIYMGAMYGGSIAAILVRTPGTPAAAATIMDGYPMAQKGEAGRALGISLTASFFGGLISSVFLLTIAPVLGGIAVMFGPVELFSVAVLGMTIIGSPLPGVGNKRSPCRRRNRASVFNSRDGLHYRDTAIHPGKYQSFFRNSLYGGTYRTFLHSPGNTAHREG